MSSKVGWIKVWRKTMDNPIFYGNAAKLGFWVWCLMKASTEERDVAHGNHSVHLKAGQFIYGKKVAAVETGLAESTLYRWMKQFTRMNLLSAHAVNHEFTLVTVEKWAFYQGDGKNVRHDVNHEVTRLETTVKEDKKIGEGKSAFLTLADIEGIDPFEENYYGY